MNQKMIFYREIKNAKSKIKFNCIPESSKIFQYRLVDVKKDAKDIF